MLLDIERRIAGLAPERRAAVRQSKATPQLDALPAWLDTQLRRIPGKSELAGAIRYARSRWQALTRWARRTPALEHGAIGDANRRPSRRVNDRLSAAASARLREVSEEHG